MVYDFLQNPAKIPLKTSVPSTITPTITSATSPPTTPGGVPAAQSGYTPLTQQQYQSAISAGFSPTQIIANEKIRKASATPSPSFGSRLKTAFGQTMNSLPGFLESPLHIADPLTKGLATGIRSVQATPDILTGNLAGANKTMSTPITLPGGAQIPTLGSSTNIQNVGTAAEAVALLPGAGEVSSIVSGNTARAATQGAIQGAIGGGGQYLANAKAPTALGTLGAVGAGAAGGAIMGGTAPTLLEQAQKAPGEPYIQGVKTAAGAIKDTVTSIPAKIKSSISNEPTPLETQVAKTDEAIQKGLEKGVKPSVVGKGTQAKRTTFENNSIAAVKNIADLRDQIKITDTNGEPVIGAPKTVAQGAQATDQAMKLIWAKSEAAMTAAGEKGAVFDPTTVTDKLKTESEDIGNDPSLRETYKALIPAVEELKGQTPTVVAKRLAQYNADLQSYYKSGVGGDTVTAKASAMAVMRQAMDSSIESALQGAGNQDLRNQYGEMKALDKEMQHRATVVGRQNPKSLFGGITDAGALAELVRGVMTMNPADLAVSLGLKGLNAYVKNLNSPDANVGRMFNAAYNLKDSATAQGIDSLRNLTPQVMQTAAKATDLTNKNGGVTISLKGEIPTKGFSVATSKLTEQTVPQDQFTSADTAKYVQKNWSALQQGNNYLGLWVDNGKVYLDVPSVFDNKVDAVKAAQAADQLGIFDLEKFETIGKDQYEKIISDDETKSGRNTGAVRPASPPKSGGPKASGQSRKASNPPGVVGSGTGIGLKTKPSVQ